jgi:hypothetical protein
MPRYETAIHCTLEAHGTGTWVGGVITDLSLGGAAIDVLGRAPREFVLVFSQQGEALRLPCSTRLLRDLWNRRRVHAQFLPLPARQQESLKRVLAELRERQERPTGGSSPLAGAVRRWRR